MTKQRKSIFCWRILLKLDAVLDVLVGVCFSFRWCTWCEGHQNWLNIMSWLRIPLLNCESNYWTGSLSNYDPWHIHCSELYIVCTGNMKQPCPARVLIMWYFLWPMWLCSMLCIMQDFDDMSRLCVARVLCSPKPHDTMGEKHTCQSYVVDKVFLPLLGEDCMYFTLLKG